MRILSMVCLLAFVASSFIIGITSAAAQPLDGTIDYVKGTVTATGIGAANLSLPEPVRRPAAIRAAKADAFRNLLETIKGVHITGETTVENYMLASDYIHTQVEGVVKNFIVTDTKYMNDGTVEVTVEMKLAGDFADVVLPERTGGAVPIEMTTSGVSPAVYTGLLVDGRGLGIQPAMAPKIYNEQGYEIYGTGYVSREYAVKMGVVGYHKDVSMAKQDSRITNNPFLIKAIKASGANNVDVVISDNDAAVLHGMSENLSFLEKARVMIIVD